MIADYTSVTYKFGGRGFETTNVNTNYGLTTVKRISCNECSGEILQYR